MIYSFEFPLYQWIVASAVKVGGFPIDQTGRFVSVLFFILALYPIFKILKALKLTTNNILLILSLICFSPQYIFWSRTFMIESIVLALSFTIGWCFYI
jgi:4-amino-4-deoxy-L-arabinose transferase-like glycosyltransferase